MTRVSFTINRLGMEIDMKHRKFFLLVTSYTILSLLTGCGQLHDAEINLSDSGPQQDFETNPTDYGSQPDSDTNLTDYEPQQNSDTGFTENDSRQNTDVTPVYRQAALYIQEGFRKYNVKDSYHAYFAEPEASGESRCVCEILLAGEDGYWEERNWEWSDTAETEWIQTVRDNYEHFGYTTEDYNDSFYLTEDSLGLITSFSRYYNCMEAEFEQLDGLASLP